MTLQKTLVLQLLLRPEAAKESSLPKYRMRFADWLLLREESLNKTPLGLYDKYKVFSVNEKAMRDKTEDLEEYGDYAIHEDYPDIIPKDEVWVSEEISPKERPVIIATALKRLQWLDKGKSSGAAYDKSIKYAKSVRSRREHAKKRPYETNERAPNDLYVKHYMSIHDPKGVIDVWIVDGEKVRDLYKTDYIEGGHGFVYDWVPNNEIWIEEDLKPSEIPPIILHEYVELRLMRDHDLSYDKAHEIASKVEFRHRGKDSDEMLLSPDRYIRKEDLANMTSPGFIDWVASTYVKKENEYHQGPKKKKE